MRQRFLRLTRQVIAGELDSWSAEPSRALALVLLLDQSPRQIWHNTAMAFAGDPQALALSQKAVAVLVDTADALERQSDAGGGAAAV